MNQNESVQHGLAAWDGAGLTRRQHTLESVSEVRVAQAQKNTVVLCILDGVGWIEDRPDNAVSGAETPHLDQLMAGAHARTLRAHGTAVGLASDKDMGNSEVGHNALGCGQVVDQGAKRVDLALRSGEAFETPCWKRLTARPALHVIGLLSDGNVHAHIDHLLLLLRRAAADGVKTLRVHMLTDGRDVAPRSALTYLTVLEAELASLRDQGVDACIASGGGRMHMTMDRYGADWPMVERGWNCHVHGEGRIFASAGEAVSTYYAEDPDVDDQWLPAFVIAGQDGQPVGPIRSGDAVLLSNFRGDRALEISEAFDAESFSHFERNRPDDVFYAGMMEYDGDLKVPRNYLVEPPQIDDTVSHQLSAHGLRSFACSETQKFGHVTYFFNGNRAAPIDAALERWVEVPSDNRPFDEAPWMKAAEVTDVVIEALAQGDYDFVRCNLANGDMVGHTGNLQATKVAMAAVDLQLGRLQEAAARHGAVLLVTADHGNADEMVQRSGGKVLTDEAGTPIPKTSHTLAPVPFAMVGPCKKTLRHDVSDAGIASVGSTVLDLLGVTVPTGWAPTLLEEGP